MVRRYNDVGKVEQLHEIHLEPGNIDGNYAHVDLLDFTERIMECLSVKERQVVETLFYDGMKAGQASEYLEILRHSLFRIRRRALDKLREECDGRQVCLEDFRRL